MNQWIRLYRASLHNPKVVTLNDRQHRAWHNCLLMADDTGTLPKMRDMACHMRMTVQEAEQVICELVEAGLVDIEGTGPARAFKMHDWKTQQYVSDNSTERVKKFRSKNKGAHNETAMKRFSNGTATPPESESESETDINTLGLPSSQVAARAREVEDLRGVNKFFGMKDDRKKEKIVSRAEGLGLNVKELTDACNAHKPTNRPAYFTALCVAKLQAQLPGIEEGVIRAALWDKTDEAYKALIACLMEAA